MHINHETKSVTEHMHYFGQCQLCGADNFCLGESPNVEGCRCIAATVAGARASVTAFITAAYAIGVNPLPHLRAQGRKAQWLGAIAASDEWRVDCHSADGQEIWVVVSDPRPKTGSDSEWAELGGKL